MKWNDIKFWICTTFSVFDVFMFLVVWRIPHGQPIAKLFLFSSVLLGIGAYGAFVREKHDAFLESNNKKPCEHDFGRDLRGDVYCSKCGSLPK